ncbi:ATP-dependent Clp protease proteolytic subunit 3, chloroplastic [Tanacetum coccineum]
MSTILSESALEKALQAALELLKKAAQVLLKKAAEALKRHAGALARKMWMHEGMGIYAAMKQRKADISTICVGLAASMDAFLLACGTKGKRFLEKVYHKVKSARLSQEYQELLYEKVEADTGRDYFVNAWQAKAYGLVEENGRIGGEDGDGQKTEEAASA